MTVGVAYHVALVVRLDGWSISTNQDVEAYGEVAAFLHTFRMHTFFLLSGFFAAMLLTKKGSTSYLRERLWRIAIPMVACGLTVQLLMLRDESWDTFISRATHEKRLILIGADAASPVRGRTRRTVKPQFWAKGRSGCAAHRQVDADQVSRSKGSHGLQSAASATNLFTKRENLEMSSKKESRP